MPKKNKSVLACLTYSYTSILCANCNTTADLEEAINALLQSGWTFYQTANVDLGIRVVGKSVVDMKSSLIMFSKVKA